MTKLDELLQYYARFGGTDTAYLEAHLPRFLDTKSRFVSSWDRNRGVRVLDVGAHWLHQSLLYAQDGFDVVALDMPVTFDIPSVRAVAEQNAIKLLAEEDLSTARSLDAIGDHSVDIVLFTEIIEHITFNPVQMWKQIYRVMKPGGRIVITTPNYYSARGRAWDLKRFCSGFGGGLEALDILRMRTYAHHWKEYSMREVIYYFCVLSPDFNTVCAQYVQAFAPLPKSLPRWVGLLEQLRPFKPNLYLEIEVREKNVGIQLEPAW